MKKILTSTTTLAAVGLLGFGATQASAADAPQKLQLQFGGFMHQMIGWSDAKTAWEKANGTEYKKFDQKSDSEIYFQGSVKLDNGMTVGMVVQLEADLGASATFDETYMSVGGDFGTVYLGSGKSGAFKLGVSAPSAGALSPFNGDEGSWISTPSDNAGIGSSTFSGADDSNRIAYVSPSFGGLRVGGGYSPSSTSSGTQPTVSETDVADIAAQYSGKFDDIGFRIYAGYWSSQGSSTAQNDTTSVGADVTMGAFTIGGGYSNTSGERSGVAAATAVTDEENWNAGIKYAAAPYSVAFTYAASAGEAVPTVRGDDKHTRYTIGAGYDIGPGVELLGTVAYNKTKDEASAATVTNDGYMVVGGIKVSF